MSPPSFFDDSSQLAPPRTVKTELGGGAFTLHHPEPLAPIRWPLVSLAFILQCVGFLLILRRDGSLALRLPGSEAGRLLCDNAVPCTAAYRSPPSPWLMFCSRSR